MFNAVTIGSTTHDTFLEGDFILVPWKKVESGKAYLFPLGEKLAVKRAYFTVGGNAVNASVTFARNGLRTACVAKVGDDFLGKEIKERLKNEGVENKFIVSAKNQRTSYSTLLLENGERTILEYRAVANSFSLKDIDMKKVRAKWWYISLPGESHKMFGNIADFGRRNKIAIAFNPSGYHIKNGKKEILANISKLSFMVLNEEEAALLTGISFKNEKAVFKKLDRLTPGILAVTDGKNGVTVSDGRLIYRAGVFKEKKLIDRTGAGDAFGSGFVAGLINKGANPQNIASVKPDDVCYAIRLATANATSVVEKIGATEGVIRKKEFEKNGRWKSLKITVHKI
ncbi:MAG: carbohydrate kinase family protein [Candidatus Liptonbacteria bacterium]|nr:carbohydrate kinase family protein [Candidatus Liptonbacteria bacterium]